MQVAAWMSSPVRTVAPTTSAADAVAVLRRHRIRHLPVVEGDRVVGVVTDRDLRSGDAGQRVSAIMSRPVVVVSPRTAIDKAARLLFDRRIGCLPVVDEGKLVGILTQTDAVAALVAVVRTRVGGGTVEVAAAYRPDAMALAHTAIRDLGGETARLFEATREPMAGSPPERVWFRIETRELTQVLEALRAAGLEIVAAPAEEPGSTPAGAREPTVGPTPRPPAGRIPSIDAADLAAAIERAAGDLALAEEPARFTAALETHGATGGASPESP